jgi:UDP-N-acetylglucosamine 2-epimerase
LFINERPITVTHGTNVIAGVKKNNIVNAAHTQLSKFSKACAISPPPFWDGKAAERIVEILANESGGRIQKPESDSTCYGEVQETMNSGLESWRWMIHLNWFQAI